MGVPALPMLRFLDVRHLAVIDHLQLELEPGFNVITGETGAGKSILIDAIDLLVGGRASPELVRTGEATATAQAVFEDAGGREVIVRREVSAQGRSRAFIDDALATSAALRDLGARLVELHGQHEHQGLLDPAQHVAALDAFLDEPALAGEVAGAFAEWRTAVATLDRSQLDDREKRARIEMAEFQLQEIDRVAPAAGEDVQLEAERGILANADRLSRLAQEAYGALYDEEHAALPRLATVWRRVADLAAIDDRFAAYLAQREAVQASLDDLAFFLRGYASGIDTSPARLQAVEDRLALIDRLKRKYGPLLEDVLAMRTRLAEELADLGASAEQAAGLAARERETRGRFLELAAALSTRRHDAARRLGRELARSLADLAMPHARVDIRIERLARAAEWTERGIDGVEFFISPNPGEEPRALARIASGGELSRIMLALHSLAAVEDGPRTLVFDEVDAGIGGAAADAVGARLQALGRRHQILCITHLPQVAARATAHFALSKSVEGGRTTTRAARLDSKGRELELARMIAGLEVTEHVRASARELLLTRMAPAGESESDESESKENAKGESDRTPKAKGRRRGA